VVDVRSSLTFRWNDMAVASAARTVSMD